jgi:CRP-like cAMP-binding protein
MKSTELEIAITRPQRWDVPFGEMTDTDVERLLHTEPFRSIDATAFPPTLPLRGILQGDTRIGHYQPGDVVVREGDYGNSAFLVLAGSVRVVLDRLKPSLLGRESTPRRSWWQAVAQLWQNSPVPETRSVNGTDGAENGTGSRTADGTTRVFLQDFPRILAENGTAEIGPGEFFGELAALSRTPRSATVLAGERATLLEIRWQGLRDLMRRTPAIREHIDRTYRENSLRVHLRETNLFKDLPTAVMDRVVVATEFESYGNFDWYTDFGANRHRDATEQIAAEPLIAAEGDRPSGLLLIRSGFARVSQRHGHGQRTLAYLGKGQVFGLAELTEAAESGADVVLGASLRAVGYVDVLRIPADVVKDIVAEHGQSKKGNGRKAKTTTQTPHSIIEPGLLDFLADRRFLNGTETMLIDLNRCTRCDDCTTTTRDSFARGRRRITSWSPMRVCNASIRCA